MHSKSNKSQHGGKREISAEPFCWQHKEALRIIDNNFEQDVGSAHLVYLAMTRIASDEGAESFTRPISQIAKLAGVSYRTASPILHRFEALGLIRVQRNTVTGTKEHAPSTYTMLGNGCLTLGKRHASSFAESIKETKKKRNDDTRTRASDDVKQEPAIESSSSSILVLNLEEAKKHPYWKKFCAYCEARNGLPTLKGFNTWLKKQPPPTPPRKVTSGNGADAPPPISDEKRVASVNEFKADWRKKLLKA